MGKPVALHDVRVCPDCDMILATGRIDVPYGSHLVCPRCHSTVLSPRKDTVPRTLAFSIAGLILYIPAHFMVLLTFDILGMYESGSVFDSIRSLYRQQYGLVSLAVILTAQVIPLLKLGLLSLVNLGIGLGIYRSLLPVMLRWYQHLEEWGMSEVYLIGILVTVIKMAPTTRIDYEAGLVCFAGLVCIMTCVSFTFDRQHCWARIEELLAVKNRVKGLPDGEQNPFFQENGRTAVASGLLLCRTCHKVIRQPAIDALHTVHCPRCGSRVHRRVLHSVTRTWALVVTAAILCFPANLLPIMEVTFLGAPDQSTIMDGINYFFRSGSYGIGLIILSASILVPVFKIIGLAVLLYSINFRRMTRLVQKTRLFRFISFIGRWSMLDIFIIALLSALVNFGFFSTIRVAPAATFFTFVVLTTMLAALSFDQRLLWDVMEPDERWT